MYCTLYAIVLMYSLGRSFISKKVLDYVLCYTLLKFATSSKESNSGQLYITTVYTVCIILYMRYVCGNYNGTSGSRTLCFATEVISVSGSWLSCCLLPVSLWRRWERTTRTGRRPGTYSGRTTSHILFIFKKYLCLVGMVVLNHFPCTRVHFLQLHNKLIKLSVITYSGRTTSPIYRICIINQSTNHMLWEDDIENLHN